MGCTPSALFSCTVCKAGRSAIPYDIEYTPHNNLLSNHGYLCALINTLRVRPGGGKLAAPVCSSFVYMPLESVGNKFNYQGYL